MLLCENGGVKPILLLLMSSCEIGHTEKPKGKEKPAGTVRAGAGHGWPWRLRTSNAYLGRLCWKDLEEYWRGVWPGCAGELTLVVMCGLGDALCWLWSSVGRLRQAWICLQVVHHKSELLLLLMWNWGEAFITKNYAQRCMKKCTQWPPLSSVSLCALKWHPFHSGWSEFASMGRASRALTILTDINTTSCEK